MAMMLVAGPASADDPSSLPGISVVGERDGEVGGIDLDAQPTTASRLGLEIHELPAASSFLFGAGALVFEVLPEAK